MEPFNWVCPYCNKNQTVVDNKYIEKINKLYIKDQYEGDIALVYKAIGCSNPECKRTTVIVEVRTVSFYQPVGWYVPTDSTCLFHQTILPQGSAKPQPDYIPEPIREDYKEACLIRDLSPKASATLTRRCLQGMIRDFAGITKSNLFQEIDALRKSVEDGSADRSISPESVEAIDQVRGIGNIGAHMEKDIDKIIPVEPAEAQALIDLVEMLFDELYGAREKRQRQLDRIKEIAADKKEIKAGD